VKKGAIIGLGAGCFVVVFVVMVLAFVGSGADFGESVGNVLTYDCAKGWDDYMSFINRDFKIDSLSESQLENLGEDMKKTMDGFFKNKCISKIDDWSDRAQDKVVLPTILEDRQMRQQYIDIEWRKFVKFQILKHFFTSETSRV